MASLPSGSSGGAGNGPPKKRSKMETKQQSAQSLVREMQTEHLKCPVCLDYPRKEVFQCANGHLICNGCITQIERCPVCRVKYRAKKIRNLTAEADLENMTYNCSFKDNGCLRTNISRNRRTAHEIQCAHNSSPTGVKFCHLFNATGVCQFRICPKSMVQDPQHTNDVIQHLKTYPLGCPSKSVSALSYKKVKIGEKYLLGFRLPIWSCEPYFQPVKLFEVYDKATRKTIGYYVLILRSSMPDRKNLSWAVVGLNSAPDNLNGGNPDSISGKMTVEFCMKAKTDTAKMTKDGKNCVPDLSWTVKSTYLNEWKEFMMIPNEDRAPFSFSIPEVFVADYFYDKLFDEVKMTVTFGSVVG